MFELDVATWLNLPFFPRPNSFYPLRERTWNRQSCFCRTSILEQKRTTQIIRSQIESTFLIVLKRQETFA